MSQILTQYHKVIALRFNRCLRICLWLPKFIRVLEGTEIAWTLGISTWDIFSFFTWVLAVKLTIEAQLKLCNQENSNK